VSRAPASGERGALRGYRWQYDHIAARAYDSLLDGDFQSVRLTDPSVGQVDDLVLLRRGRVDGYQFKSVEFDSYVTFNQLIKEQRTRSGKPAPSLVRAMADGWKALHQRYGGSSVHLVTQQLASVNDHLSEEGSSHRPSPDHLSAFRLQVLEPIRVGTLSLTDVPPGWRPALEVLQRSSGLEDEAFEPFLRAFNLDVAAGGGLPATGSTRRADIVDLSNALFRLVSESAGIVELDRHALLELVGWGGRPLLRSRHEFPVDLDTYAPLDQAIDELNAQLSQVSQGYIAVVGPPGAGKSTLLSQALSGRGDRVVRYYAYVPGTAAARTRLTGRGFLHDVVVMLQESGLSSRERQLPSEATEDLRQQLADQLDAATAEFARTGRRAIVVVDGLDHVDRDYSGADGLLGELPAPDALPDGVIFLVGSRTLAPLHAYARHQVEARNSLVDLQHHPLSTAAVLEVCRRAPVTAELAPELHRRIAEQSRGHPLAMSYLLNRLRDIDGGSPEDLLAEAPPYAGDIAAEYLAVWDQLETDHDVLAILEVVSRLRVGFTTEWIASWAPAPAVRTFRLRLQYLFRHHHDGWRFFHDSFRQFASDRTAGATIGLDHMADAVTHARVAELCSQSHDIRIRAEELFHRVAAGDLESALSLGQIATFREQYRDLRAPELIRSDITSVLAVAAGRGDAVAILRGLLALTELTQRTDALEDIDFPGLLYDAGLVDEAIGVCGAEARRVPLAYAYGLAARLGRAGDPAGRRIFDLVEHDGFDDPERIRTSGREDEAALAWVQAAPLFRPLRAVLDAIWRIVDEPSSTDRDDRYRHGTAWRRFERMMTLLISTVDASDDEPRLLSLDAALSRFAETVVAAGVSAADDSECSRFLQSDLATLIDLRVRVQEGLVRLANSAEAARQRLDALLTILRESPLFYSTMLDAAELFATHGLPDVARKLVEDSPYARALTVRSFGHDSEPDVLERHFRYWRLRYLLAHGGEEVPDSIQPSQETPAGDGISPTAPVHSDTDAIELAARIDDAIRLLACLDAAVLGGEPTVRADDWARIVPLVDVVPTTRSRRRSASLEGVARKRLSMLRLLAGVVLRYGEGMPQRFVALIDGRIAEDPDRWPVGIQLDLADTLRDAGLDAPWYAAAVAAERARASAQDVYSRLDDTAALVRRYSRDGDLESARDLALSLVPMAFGVGYRKDYQFDLWVAWLGRALAEDAGLLEDAIWLARVLTAADPMTEGAPGSAAADLPAAIAPGAPLTAVRVFEYLVRHGTVDHLDSLAATLQSIVTNLPATGGSALAIAADLTAELLAPAANRAYPDLARNIVQAATRVDGRSGAQELARAIAERCDRYALPTTRRSWLTALGVPVPDEQGDDESSESDTAYGALVLTDGRRIARWDVSGMVRSTDDVIALKQLEAEESSFGWGRVVDALELSAVEVRTLLSVFDERDPLTGGDVVASLAAAAERVGDSSLALRLAKAAIQKTSPDAWSSHYGGGSRRRAAAIAIRVGGESERIAVCQDLAQHIAATGWFHSMLLHELDDIVEALDPGLSAATTWPEVRSYLDGIADTLSLPGGDVLDDLRCRWWLLPDTSDSRASPSTESPEEALAELAVGHLSHATWLVRDAATRIVRGALSSNDLVVAALARFSRGATTDDMLERAGRCLAGARAVDASFLPSQLEELSEVLATHPSQVLRDLAAGPPAAAYRSLPPLYRLVLPPPSDAVIGGDPIFLVPHEPQYAMLADGLDLNEDTLLGVASRYAADVLATLPEQDAVRQALQSSHVQHTYPSEKIAASRAAFGRVLADLNDARLLDGAPRWVRKRLRTFDPYLLGESPVSRPSVIPSSPEAGHDQTLERWRAELVGRLDEYVAASVCGDTILIGAKVDVTVLNWGHLEEIFQSGLSVGQDQELTGPIFQRRSGLIGSDLREPTPQAMTASAGQPLIVENVGHAFHQIHADWLAFRPEAASALSWTPDTQPGRWRRASGEVAVDTVWWVDGWWGRAGPAFDDTEMQGHAVLLTAGGLEDLLATFGELTRHFTLQRKGRDDGMEVDVGSIARSVPL
jgi:type II secretory pathway predicted ATPase ExeA